MKFTKAFAILAVLAIAFSIVVHAEEHAEEEEAWEDATEEDQEEAVPAKAATTAAPELIVGGNQGNYIRFGRKVPAKAFDFAFSAQAQGDIHVAFMCGEYASTKVAYEVVIGGWGNTRSVIRRGTTGEELVNAAGARATNDKMTFYYVSYQQGVISVSSTSQSKFMSVKADKLPCEELTVAFTSWHAQVRFANQHYNDDFARRIDVVQGNQGQYTYFANTVPAKSFDVAFEAQSSGDICVALMCGRNARTQNAYEVIIGGWGNTRSVIRQGTQGKELTVNQGAHVSATKMTTYWISYQNGIISMSSSSQKSILSIKANKLPCDDLTLAVAGWGAPVRLKNIHRNTNFAKNGPTILNPAASNATNVKFTVEGNESRYRKFGKKVAATGFHVAFSAQAKNDINVAFMCGQNERTPNAYEITIGGWDNTKSAIRLGTQGKELVGTQGARATENKMTTYWVSYENGYISVSSFSKDNFMRVQASKLPCETLTVAFAGWANPVQISNVHYDDTYAKFNPKTPSPATVEVLGNQARYLKYWKTVSSKSFNVAFSAQGASDINVAFTCGRTPQTQNAYEVVIGAWDNTKSFIHHGTQSTELAVVLGARATADKMTTYWVSYENGVISVSSSSQDNFMKANAKKLPCEKLTVTFAGWGKPVQISNVHYDDTFAKFNPKMPSLKPSTVRGNQAHYVLFWKTVAAKSFSVAFSAQAESDINMAIMCGKQNRTQNAYEIVIGAEGNTKSFIRRGTQGKQLGWASGARATADKMTTYWVSYADGIIYVSSSSQDSFVIAKASKLPCEKLTVSFAGWRKPVNITNVHYDDAYAKNNPIKPTLKTITVPGNQAHYVSFWKTVAAKSFDLAFSAQAAGDINMAIMCGKSNRTTNAYEIVIGAAGNTKSLIRSGTQGKELVVAQGARATANKMTSYWVSYENGALSVSSFSQDNFMKANVNKLPCERVTVAFAGLGKPVQIANVHYGDNYAKFNPKTPVVKTVTVPGNHVHYVSYWKTVSARDFDVAFSAQGKDDVNVALMCGKQNRTQNAYEIVIGGWGNTRSVIRQGTQGKELVVAQGARVTADKLTTYWVSYEAGVLSVSSSSQDDFLTVKVNKLPCDKLTVTFAGWDNPVQISNVHFDDTYAQNEPTSKSKAAVSKGKTV